MKQWAYLILENGKIMRGESFGATGDVVGEIVFTTGMTGYLETLTDQSYYGQIVLQTFPLIGNYGVIPEDFERDRIALSGYIVKSWCETPSNFRSESDIDTLLKERGVVGICGIDTRALAKIVRESGVMNGKITAHPPTEADLAEVRAFQVTDAVANVTAQEITKEGSGTRRVALIDYGAKGGIAKELLARDCEVWTFPCDTTAEEILGMKPDGIMLSNGPGDPADPANVAHVETLRVLKESGVPIFGICLGHQLLALANGYATEKLKFGHRGANQPVKDTATGQLYITSQNHGYAVVASDSSFVSVNDGTCEGLDYGSSFSVQFHPEARGGPLDTRFLFDRFIERMDRV